MKNPDTKSKFHPMRVRGRAQAASILAAAQRAVLARDDDSVTDHALGKRWGNPKPISHSAIAAFFNPESGHALTFGDLLALPRDLARDALMRALVALDTEAGPGTRDTLDAIQIDLANAVHAYRNDLVDGSEDEHAKHEANLARIATIAMRGCLASQQRKAGT